MNKNYMKEYKDLTLPELQVETAVQRLRLDVNIKNIKESDAALTLIGKAIEYKLEQGVSIERLKKFTNVFDNIKKLEDMLTGFKKDYKEITERLQVLEALA